MRNLKTWFGFCPNSKISRSVPIFGMLFMLGAAGLPAAEGVRTLPDSAAAMGMAGGRLANLRDASVTRSNPSLLSTLDRPQIMITAQPWHGRTEFSGASGAKESMILPWKPLGSLYAALPISDKVTAGLGIAAPFGLAISWPRDSVFRYAAPFDALMQTAAFNPAIGFEVNEHLSVGVGLDLFFSRLKLDQYYPWGALVPGASDGIMEFEGSGWGVGGYLGVTLRLSDRQRVALTGRLPVSLDYHGDFDISNLPAALDGTFSNASGFQTDIEHPGSFGVGYGLDVTDRLTVGFDFEWIQNSAHDDLPLNIGRNQALLPVDRLALDWKDSWTAGFGLEYEIDDRWTFRSGYMFSKSAFRDRTFNAAIPSNDRHIISVGIGRTLGDGRVDLAYSLAPMRDRSIRGNLNPVFDGEYTFFWQVFSVSYTRYF